jgi:hypothetical protein
MSFIVAAVTTMAIGTAYSIYSGERAADAQKKANAQAVKQASDAAAAADRATNRANPKRPDLAAMLTGNAAAAKGGQSGTMLTGPAGVDPNALALSKTTLLGG